jgi:SET domain-containing protein
LARDVKHSRKPNAEAELVRERMIYRTRKNIAPGEEITVDYGEEYYPLYLTKTGCRCSACVTSRE